MYSKEEKFYHQQPGAQALVKYPRTKPSDMKEPHTEITEHDQRNHPQLPRHYDREHDQYYAEHRDDSGQKQMLSSLPVASHSFSISFATRFKSSSG